jgi:3-oxoadipate enol-lactonase
MDTTNRRFPVVDGELFFECAGTGEPIAFIHGFGLDSRMWDPQFDAFQSAFRVIRYDLRGFGRSSLPPAAPYSHEDDLNALLANLGGTPAHVVGLSMGGRMALRFAAAYPQSVRSLVLAAPALDGQSWSTDWQTRWTSMCSAARAGQISDAKRQWLDHPLFDSARSNPTATAHLVRMVEDYSGWHWHNKDLARVPSPALAERLGEVRVRTLVITGEDDIPDFQVVGNLLGEKLPDARRVIIPGSGHMVNLESPRDFNAALLKFWHEE